MFFFFRGRPAKPASHFWNLIKTLFGTIILWGLFFFLIPYLLFRVEEPLELDHYHSPNRVGKIVGVILFALGSVLHLVSNVVLAIRGEGTPLFLDGPRRLVIAGPYRYVRNPMAIAGLMQAVGVASFLGSPLALMYALALTFFENAILRPAQEADLEDRFGEDYRRYRQRVRCWRPRRRGYDPANESTEPPLARERTTPPGHPVVLYDGHCKFCIAGMKRLLSLARPGTVEAVNFQEPGALDRFPGISHEACMRQMYLITNQGQVFAGFEAAVQALATRPFLGWLAKLYYLPILRLILDLTYALIAANRYRILGRAVAAGECEGGTCALHLPVNSGRP